MARKFAYLQGAIWMDPEWRTLSRGAQWTYMMLISQNEISNCGGLPLVARRWAGYASDIESADLESALLELENAGYILCDQHTQELLIRTFVKHDRIEKQPQLLAAAVRQFGETRSPRIQALLVSEYPHLFADSGEVPEGVPEGVENPLVSAGSGGVPEGVPAGLRLQAAGLGLPAAGGGLPAEGRAREDEDLAARREELRRKAATGSFAAKRDFDKLEAELAVGDVAEREL